MARGLDRHLKGNLAGAIADYGRAIICAPDSEGQAVAYLSRGNARKDQEDLAGAINDYSQAIALHPSNAGAYLSRGLAHRQVGQWEQAIADFRMVRELTTNPQWRRQADEQLAALRGEQAGGG